MSNSVSKGSVPVVKMDSRRVQFYATTCMSFSLFCGLKLVYPNPHLREPDLKLICAAVEIISMSPFSWQGQNLCWPSLEFIIGSRVVIVYKCWQVIHSQLFQSGVMIRGQFLHLWPSNHWSFLDRSSRDRIPWLWGRQFHVGLFCQSCSGRWFFSCSGPASQLRPSTWTNPRPAASWTQDQGLKRCHIWGTIYFYDLY